MLLFAAQPCVALLLFCFWVGRCDCGHQRLAGDHSVVASTAGTHTVYRRFGLILDSSYSSSALALAQVASLFPLSLVLVALLESAGLK